MVMPNPQDGAAKWAQNFSGSGQRWLAGVQGVTTPPGQAAARQKALYIARVTAMADVWARRVASVSTQQWQADCETKGLPRFASGADAGKSKYEAAAVTLYPFIKTAVQGLPARGDLEANINRSAQFARAMAKYKTG